MHTTPYVFFPGTCRAAMVFYAETLGAEAPFMMTKGDMPPEDQAQMPPGMPDDAVMHAAISHGDFSLFASDEAEPGQPGGRVALHLTVDTDDDAKRIFAAFAQGGEITMPLEATFWTAAFGRVTDQFGISWMISTPDTA